MNLFSPVPSGMATAECTISIYCTDIVDDPNQRLQNLAITNIVSIVLSALEK